MSAHMIYNIMHIQTGNRTYGAKKTNVTLLSDVSKEKELLFGLFLGYLKPDYGMRNLLKLAGLIIN